MTNSVTKAAMVRRIHSALQSGDAHVGASGKVYEGVGTLTMVNGDPIVYRVSRGHIWSDGHFGHVGRRVYRQRVSAEADEALQRITEWQDNRELCFGDV